MHKSKVQERRLESIWPASNCHTSRTLIVSLWVFTCSKPIRQVVPAEQFYMVMIWHEQEAACVRNATCCSQLLSATPPPLHATPFWGPKNWTARGFKRIKHFSLISTRLVFSCSTDISQKQTEWQARQGDVGRGTTERDGIAVAPLNDFPPKRDKLLLNTYSWLFLIPSIHQTRFNSHFTHVPKTVTEKRRRALFLRANKKLCLADKHVTKCI